MSKVHQPYQSANYFNHSNPNGGLSTPIGRAQHGAPAQQLPDGSYARTREEQFSRHFGAPKMAVNFPGEGYNQGHYQLPEAYKGQSLMLSEVMIRKITADERVGTRILAPFVRHEGGMTISWDRWEFNNHLPTRVPEEGVSRMVSMSKSAEQDSMVRYGMALELEHGFMTTEQGQMNYRLNLEQIKNGVVEGTEMGVSVKLLNASNTFDNFYERTGAGLGAFAIDDALRQETALYCAPQKRRDGMIAIKQYIEKTLQQRGQTGGFVMVVPQGLKDQIDSNETEAVSLINKSANGPRNPVFGQMGLGQVYESRGFYIDSARPTLDIHYTPSYKGEFNFITYKHLMDLSPEQYQTSFAAIQVYDEDRDNFVKIDAHTTLRKNGLFHWPRGGRDANHNDYKLTTIGTNWFNGNMTWGQFLNRHARHYRSVLTRYLESTKTGHAAKFLEFVGKHYPNVAQSRTGQNAGVNPAIGVPGARAARVSGRDPTSLRQDAFRNSTELLASIRNASPTFSNVSGIRDALQPASNPGTGVVQHAIASLALGQAYPVDDPASSVARAIRAVGSIQDAATVEQYRTILQEGVVLVAGGTDETYALTAHTDGTTNGDIEDNEIRDGVIVAVLKGWAVSGLDTTGGVDLTTSNVVQIIAALRTSSIAGFSRMGSILALYGASTVAEIFNDTANGNAGVDDADLADAGDRFAHSIANVGGCLCGVGAGLSLTDHFRNAATGNMKKLSHDILLILDPDSVQVDAAARASFIKWFADNREFYSHWPQFYESNNVPLTIGTLRYLALGLGNVGRRDPMNMLVSWVALCGEMHRVAQAAGSEDLMDAIQGIITLSAYSRVAFKRLMEKSGIIDALATHGGAFELEVVNPAIAKVTLSPESLKTFIATTFGNATGVQIHNLAVDVSIRYTNDRNQGIPNEIYNNAGVDVPERTRIVDQHTVDALLDLLPIDGRFPEWCIFNDVPPPLGALLLRPHWGHETGVTMGVLPNGRAAYTFFGHPNFEVNDNAVRKVYYGHFTWYSTTIVWNPKGVVRVFDTRSRRYIGGGGTKFYPWTRKGVESYHALSARSTPKYDMFCVPVPPCWMPSWWYLDITGRIHPQVTSRRYKQDEYHYPQSELISGILSFAHGSRAKSYEEKALRRPGSNTICCQGHQVMFDGRKERLVLSQGHWGQDVYPGCGKVRSGYFSMLRPTNYDGTAIMSIVA